MHSLSQNSMLPGENPAHLVEESGCRDKLMHGFRHEVADYDQIRAAHTKALDRHRHINQEVPPLPVTESNSFRPCLAMGESRIRGSRQNQANAPARQTLQPCRRRWACAALLASTTYPAPIRPRGSATLHRRDRPPQPSAHRRACEQVQAEARSQSANHEEE